ADHSASGRFVMFRARNDLGTGTGMGEVRIPGYPAGPLSVASATIGFSFIQLGVGDALPQRKRTFERDVYHYFTDELCNQSCHKPDGIGFNMAPKRQDANGTMYAADWSGTVDQVYAALTAPLDTDCANAGPSAARVCKAKPDV